MLNMCRQILEENEMLKKSLSAESAALGQLQTELDALDSMCAEAEGYMYRLGYKHGDIATRAKGAVDGFHRLVRQLSEAEVALIEAKKATAQHVDTIPDAAVEFSDMVRTAFHAVHDSVKPKKCFKQIRCSRQTPEGKACGDTMRAVMRGEVNICYQCTSCAAIRWIEASKIRRTWGK